MIVCARWLAALLLFAIPAIGLAGELRGTGNLGLVIERATGSVLIVDTSSRQTLGRVEGVGDLSHASAVFSPDQRYGIFDAMRADQDRLARRPSPGA
jgi:protein NirF